MSLLSPASTTFRPTTSQTLQPLKYANSRNTNPSSPTFQGFPLRHKSNGIEKLVIGSIIGILGILAASQIVPGVSGPVQEAPTTENTIGTVKPNMGLTLTVTQNGEVFNSFGAKMGTVDKDGKAFDGWGNLVGYGTDQGLVYTLSNKGREQLIGSVGTNGLFKGQLLQNDTHFGLPGLNRAQQAGLAALTIK
jgi:hypothetical protein